MADSLSGKLKGGKYKQKLQFVPDADNEPKVGHEISEPAIFRFLLNEETLEKFDEAAEVEIAKMLDVLKDIDKQSEIKEFEIHQSSMHSTTDIIKAYHAFIVFKSTSETADDGVQWWSLEKNSKFIVLQRSRNKNNVKEKLEGKPRTRVKLVEKDLKGKGTIKDLFEILWAQQVIAEKYHIKKSNCQSLVTFVGQQITNIGYKYKGNFKYSPPPEKGQNKKMLELINVIRGCSDWSPLFHLIKMGSTDLVDKIAASGKYDINASCNGLTPLHLAIRFEKTKMVKHLLEHPMNADPTKRDASGKSALLLAADMFEMKEEIIDLLLAHDKVNVDDVDGKGRTALRLAADASNVIVVRKLLEKGANPNIYDKWGQSPLHMAVRRSDSNEIIDLQLAAKRESNCNKEIIDLLLAHSKVNVDHADEVGKTALHLAVYESNVGAVKKLLEIGANPNNADKEGWSPLHVAALLGREAEIFDLLLAHDKVKVDDVDEHGQTALHFAAYKSNVMAVKRLINKGANLNAVDKSGASPLHVAVGFRDGIPIIDLILEAQKVKGIGDVNDQNEKGRTALHWAAAHSNEITAEHLIQKGADLHCRDNYGNTPFHYAVLGAEDMNIIDLLLNNINEGDIEQYKNDERLFFFARHNLHGLGNTILDRLVQKSITSPCSTETNDCITAKSDEATGVNTRRFVDKGADPSIDLTGFDFNYLDFLIARVKKSLEIDEILKDEQFDINGNNQNGETLLLVAIRENNVNAVRRLLERGADLTLPTRNPHCLDKDGFTLIHMLAEVNRTDHDILNLLLESGKVDIDATTTEQGMTALHIAVAKSNTARAEFLLSKGANPNAADRNGATPLHYALVAKDMDNLDMVELLLNHPYDVNCLVNFLDVAKFNEIGERIVNRLKEKGAVEREKKLPEVNKEFLKKRMHTLSNQKADEIESVLSDATVSIEDKIARIEEKNLISVIIDSDVESVRRLLKNGADISLARGEDGNNALHVASYWAKTTDLIDVIYETGKFDINGVDNHGLTPLHRAIRGTNRDINARHLIQLGADPTIANKKGDTPLHLAASCDDGEIETINLILENKQVDINSRNKNGRTALHNAIWFGKPITARYLLKKGADPNVADENEVTPLHLEAQNDFYWKTTELIDIILETGKCNINGVDDNGWTPLHYALMESNFVRNAASHLIRKGADPTIANKIGDTPLHFAASHAEEFETISLILENEQVDINSRGSNGRTALHHAIEASNVITVR